MTGVNLIAISGLLSFKGRVRVEMSPERTEAPSSGPPAGPRVRLTGDAEVANLAVIDAEKKQQLFRSRSSRAKD